MTLRKMVPALALAALLVSGEVAARSGGISGYSGKSGSTCRECHAGSNFDYQLPNLTGPTSVGTSETVNYTLNFNRAAGNSASRAGFNLALSNGGGSLGDPNTGVNEVRRAGSELVHATPAVGPGGNFSWDFTWTAPASTKVVTFFVCANPVNGNGGPNGNTGDGPARCTTVPIQVSVPSTAPVATNDSYGGTADTQLSVPAPGVLENDSDANDDALIAVLDSTTTSGTLELATDGSFTYSPNGGFSGSDSFTYHANDGALDSPPATVTITVSAEANNAPVAGNDVYDASRNTTLTVAEPGVLGNDADADADPLAALLVTQPANGSVNLNANGSFSYTPNTGFTGADSFTYQASDGIDNSNLATVSVTVKSAGGGGGGGSPAPVGLGILALAALLSRRRHD